ncbi:lipid II:glycine glycyltransferase (peptidoglycan interpeptide bridge formation enzyme) [Leucobacter komagatae]|uniref:Lipid II:glycine glycyltransferase (Peptidoglycan interpeptide bridge formation enzyme) n=1 Tax=Leucobacter komagatae TaxID=55969 RepID=A0A542Y521_9MICO|nr:peptidoglycan bridge formation glycyltransferase FemA/FemB family protein [Leucobacter komagatae]TQL43158.1 lipid II:glycine glycyltransferase (peptidoglycan interpeptide bridge formation enzyme) [Leucobacter komagatae]
MASLRFATADEVARWDELVELAPGGGEVWQSREYAEIKRYQRYTPRYIVGDDFPATLVLEKKIPLLGRFWYSPAGPDVSLDASGTPMSASEYVARGQRLADFAKQEGVFLLKVEPRLLASDEAFATLETAGYEPVAHVLPNVSTIILDISGDEDAIMAAFSSSTRTKIRKADKEGFDVRRVEATEENCRIMFDLLTGTAEEKFELRPYEYFRDFWQGFQAAGRGQLVLGYDGDVPVAGMFATALGQTSGYKDGASAKAKLPTGAMYRMQLEIIRWGKEQGATRHDLIGTPPSDRLDDKSHRLYGVGQYKLRLSKDVTDYVGTLDLAIKPGKVKLWRSIGDRIARRYTLATRGDVFY